MALVVDFGVGNIQHVRLGLHGGIPVYTGEFDHLESGSLVLELLGDTYRSHKPEVDPQLLVGDLEFESRRDDEGAVEILGNVGSSHG